MTPEETRKAINDAMQAAAAAIKAAVADSVCIVATFTDKQEFTHHCKVGRGNYYAQRGSVIDWIDATREAGLQPPPPPTDPDGADWWKS